MKLIRSVEEVSQFWIDKSKIHITRGNQWIDIDNGQETVIRSDTTGSVNEIGTFGECGFIFRFTDGVAAFTEKTENGFKVIADKKVLSANVVALKHLVTYDYDSSGSLSYNLFDLEEERDLFPAPLTGKIKTFGKYLFRIDDENVERIDLLSGRPTWTISLKKFSTDDPESLPTEIVQLINVIDTHLVAHISPFRLASINVETGEIEWVTRSFTEVLDIAPFFVWGTSYSSRTPLSWIFDQRNDSILLLTRFFLISFDLLTKSWNLPHSFQDEFPQWDFAHAIMDNDKLYFTGSTKGMMTNRVGAFDKAKKKVEWNYQVDGAFRRDIKVGDYLCVTDVGRTLHIFQ